MLNMHGFTGYFQDKRSSVPVTVTHPETLWGATMTDLDASATSDVLPLHVTLS
jgi:hypothetical protein